MLKIILIGNSQIVRLGITIVNDLEDLTMLEPLQFAPTLFDWLVIGSAFAGLFFSIICLSFVISTRNQLRGMRKALLEFTAGFNKAAIDANRAAEQAEISASAASRSALSAASISETFQNQFRLSDGNHEEQLTLLKQKI